MDQANYWIKLRQTRLSRRRVLAGAAAGGTSLALAGCSTKSRSGAQPPAGSTSGQAASQTPKTGGTFNGSIPVNPATLDPQASKSVPARSPASNVMSRLMRHKSASDPSVALSLQLENDLAASAESPDALTWTVKLRPDAKFQNVAPINGHAVEAEDVRTSFVRAVTLPQSAAKTYLLMLDENQIETPAKDTVVFKLKSPYGPFLQTLAGAVAGWIFPREVAGGYDPAKQVIGSGPFTFDSYTPDVGVAYKKNPGWFEQGRPYIDGVHTAIITSSSQRLAQFTAGNLDELAVGRNDLDTAKRSNPKAAVITAPWPNSYQVYGHMDDPASAYRDIRVRQAISLAIDRDAITKAVFGGQAHNNGMLSSAKQKWALPPDQLGDASKYFTFNLSEAKRLLEASGAADRFHRFYYPTKAYGPEFDTIAQMLNPMFTAAGFKMQLVPVDYLTQFINVGKGILYGHYEPDALVLCIWMSGASTAEEGLFDTLVPGGDSNHPKVDDAVVTAMATKMIATLDENERLKAALDLQRYAAGKLYYISSIPTGDTYTLVQPRIQGYNYSLGVDVAGAETYAKLWIAA